MNIIYLMITIFLSGFLIGIITLQIIHKLEKLKKIKEEIDKLKGDIK